VNKKSGKDLVFVNLLVDNKGIEKYIKILFMYTIYTNILNKIMVCFPKDDEKRHKFSFGKKSFIFLKLFSLLF